MNKKLLIPGKIKVGYQDRNDTYTKKLAYVIYYDTKGVLRKETSWNGWRSEKIPFDDFENKPTEGFVLNKGVGGTRESYGWNARNEYIRVYDPRGFEFEISVANLLFILQECTSTKGKGLEGEFVYSWDGKELVLLPVETQEYKMSTEFTSLQNNKISARDLKIGCGYTTKQMKPLTYMGRFNYVDYKYVENGKMFFGKKSHVFYDSGSKKFMSLNSMESLAELISDIPVSNYAELVDNFNRTLHSSLPVSLVKGTNKRIFQPKESTYYNYLILEKDDNCFLELILYRYNGSKDEALYQINPNKMFKMDENGILLIKHVNRSSYKLKELEGLNGKSIGNWSNTSMIYTKEEINKLNFCDFKIKLENGAEVNKNEYNL